MTPALISKLRKIAGLLASNYQGEQLAALGRANALLTQHKLTWGEVIGGEAAPMPPPRSGHRRPDPQPPDIDPAECPDSRMSDAMLREYARGFLAEHAAGAYDLGDVAFMTDVLRRARWTAKQRGGFVRSLRRAWVIRFKARVET